MFSHVMLGCSDREKSRRFYNATMGAVGVGPGQDFGKSDPPGIRDAGFGKMYLAYLRDPDGNKLCGFYRVPADQ
jgi:hypothetical protein